MQFEPDNPSYESENPLYEGPNVSKPALTKQDVIQRALQSTEALEKMAKTLETSASTNPGDAAILQLVRATIVNNRGLISLLDSKLNGSLEEMAESIQAVHRIVSRAGGARDPPEEFGTTFAVVLTLAPDKFDTIGKSMDLLRTRLMKWFKEYAKRHSVQVVAGPWLDDSLDLSQPHVNVTVKAESEGDFKHWMYRKGYVYRSPVVSTESWESYASRNHEVCTAYAEGRIDREEALQRVVGRVNKRVPKVLPRSLLTVSTVTYDSSDEDDDLDVL